MSRVPFFTRGSQRPPQGHRTYSGPRALTHPLPRPTEHLQRVLDARMQLNLDEGFTVS